MTLPPVSVARLSGVTLRYRHTVAVEAVDLDLPAGGMVGFIGRTGSVNPVCSRCSRERARSRQAASTCWAAIWPVRATAMRSVRVLPTCPRG